jgi:outer membrane receptor protein involved in Fe transport
MDVNPLYGRDTYAGQFSRPAAVASNPIYNLSDFMFGLRSQYALSSILVAHLRQDMHFLYVQDDFRVNEKLTLNLGLRSEYATPYWEQDNILTTFDPNTRTLIAAKDGSIGPCARQPRSEQLGPRLCPGSRRSRRRSSAAVTGPRALQPAAAVCCRSTA